jgi:tetracycline 7-halogenase / FADH2 O2-dependent halogenase
MKDTYDVLIIGSGFAGSLLATILATNGRRVALLDRESHPRFAIGESSTPIADLILDQLCDRYSLHGIRPLARYGTWKEQLPDLVCGKKRGFSYFRHQRQTPYGEATVGQQSLLVTASASDAKSDTHWMRADVDRFLADQAVGTGVDLHAPTHIGGLKQEADGRWAVDTDRGPIHARWLIDGSGDGRVLHRLMGKQLGIDDATDTMSTVTESSFSHVIELPRWNAWMESRRSVIAQQPFDADDAAQHHLVDDGWVWVLRFDDGRTSIGRVWDRIGRSKGEAVQGMGRSLLEGNEGSPARGIHSTGSIAERLDVQAYPSLAQWLDESQLASTPGRWFPRRQVQFRASRFAGHRWAMLPATAMRLDPLHSTGIAHALCGVERLAGALCSSQPQPAIDRYSMQLQLESQWLDGMIAGCYRAMRDGFDTFAAFSMTYFAITIAYEEARANGWNDRLRSERGLATAAWLVDDPTIQSITDRAIGLLEEKCCGAIDHPRLVEGLRAVLSPINRAGLLQPETHNRYAYTAAPK